jgi:hypothetical protein
MIVGYARVSTNGQTLDHQHSALRAAGAEKVFAEKISGAVTERKALRGWIGSPGPRAICSTCSTRSAKRGRASDRWPMLGPTRQPLTAG